MTTAGPTDPQAPAPESKVEPDTLELRAQPRPVTRINRKVLIGAAAVVLLLIAGLVLVALRAPSLRVAGTERALQCRAQADRGCALQAAGDL